MDLDNTTKAVEFLKQFIPNGLWILTAIDPEKNRNIETRTFSATTADQAIDWIADRNGLDNLYFSVNQPEQGNYGKKLTKEQIAVVHFFHVDVDPEKGKELELQRKQIFDRLTVRRPEAVPRPTAIFFSGGGYQAFWRLEEPGVVENDGQRGAYEEVNKWLEEQLGADNCFNLDRIMRLPWTMNLPTAVKKKAGRVETLAKVLEYDPTLVHKFTDFDLTSEETTPGDQDKPRPTKVDTEGLQAQIVEEIHGGPESIDDIIELQEKWNVPTRTLHIIREGEGDDDDKIKKIQAGKDLSRSEWLYDVVCTLERCNVPRPIILGVIMEPNLDRWKISDSVINNKDYPSPLDYAVRQIRNAATTVTKERLESRTRIEALDFEDDITELLYEESRGTRANMAGVRSREEAEELDPLLKLLNKLFTDIKHVSSKPRIASFFRKPEIGNGKTLGLNKVVPTDFFRQYPMIVTTGYTEGKDGQPGKPVTAKIMEWWSKHRYHNVKDRITFAPERHLPNALNEWNGFTYEADASGKCDLFLAMIKYVICSDNEEYYSYVLDWCARMFQYPGAVGQVALVLKGGSGIGKSFFAQQLGELLVSNFYETAKMDRLTSNFNATLRTTVLLFLDEALFGGDKKQYDVLKKLLVNNTLDVEAKGYEQETVANCLHIILASNHDYVVPAQFDDRRLLVLEVSDSQQKKREYFGPIEDQLKEDNNAGYKSLFNFFRNRDISKFSVDKVPQTIALDDQKEHALTMSGKWLLDKLWAEDLGYGRWPDKITVASLWKLYQDEMILARATKYDMFQTSKELSKFFREALQLPMPTSTRTKCPAGKPEHSRGWTLAAIEESRVAWGRTNWKNDWPEIENECTKTEEPEIETEVTEGKYEKTTPF